MDIKLDSKFKQKITGMFGKYEFKVGILQDGPHRDAMRGKNNLTQYAGGSVRKKTRTSRKTIAEVSKELSERTGINYLTDPFQQDDGATTTASVNNKDIINFTDAFFKLVFGRTQQKRAENLLQAVVRNPILRGDYGHNTPTTQKIKGFDRFMIDTAQLFRAIKAKCRVK